MIFHSRRSPRVVDLFNKQAGLCLYCDRSMVLPYGYLNSITRDHVLPKSRGGRGESCNIVGACFECNQKKGSRDVFEFLVAENYGVSKLKQFLILSQKGHHHGQHKRPRNKSIPTAFH